MCTHHASYPVCTRDDGTATNGAAGAETGDEDRGDAMARTDSPALRRGNEDRGADGDARQRRRATPSRLKASRPAPAPVLHRFLDTLMWLALFEMKSCSAVSGFSAEARSWEYKSDIGISAARGRHVILVIENARGVLDLSQGLCIGSDSTLLLLLRLRSEPVALRKKRRKEKTPW